MGHVPLWAILSGGACGGTGCLPTTTPHVQHRVTGLDPRSGQQPVCQRPMHGGVPAPVSLPIAGADAGAKMQVAALATQMGLKPIDVGGISFAHNLEDMARLRMTFHAHNHPMGFDYYLQQRADLE